MAVGGFRRLETLPLLPEAVWHTDKTDPVRGARRNLPLDSSSGYVGRGRARFGIYARWLLSQEATERVCRGARPSVPASTGIAPHERRRWLTVAARLRDISAKVFLLQRRNCLAVVIILVKVIQGRVARIADNVFRQVSGSTTARSEGGDSADGGRERSPTSRSFSFSSSEARFDLLGVTIGGQERRTRFRVGILG